MLCGKDKRFFPGSYARLGELKNPKYRNERCVVEKYVKEKDRWIVKLWTPAFNGEKILVSEANILFECYAIPDKDVSVLPTHLHVTSSDIGEVLICKSDWEAGAIIFEEPPLMIVANMGGDSGFEARWQLYWALENDRGPSCAVLQAFGQLTNGGSKFVEEYMVDGRSLFKKVVGASKSPQEVEQFCAAMPDFVEEEALRIATVLSRWQSNSHDFAALIGVDQSGLFRFASKMNHSCECNCKLQVDSDTGACIVRASRKIKAGEQLTGDYMGGDPSFHALGVEGRRARLSRRGFVCGCTRCEREESEASESKTTTTCENTTTDGGYPSYD